MQHSKHTRPWIRRFKNIITVFEPIDLELLNNYMVGFYRKPVQGVLCSLVLLYGIIINVYLEKTLRTFITQGIPATGVNPFQADP